MARDRKKTKLSGRGKTETAYASRDGASAGQDLLHELGSSLREERRKLGISQEELAGLTAVDRSYISDIERGVSSPTFLVLLRLTHAMDIKLWRLVKRIQG